MCLNSMTIIFVKTIFRSRSVSKNRNFTTILKFYTFGMFLAFEKAIFYSKKDCKCILTRPT